MTQQEYINEAKTCQLPQQPNKVDYCSICARWRENSKNPECQIKDVRGKCIKYKQMKDGEK